MNSLLLFVGFWIGVEGPSRCLKGRGVSVPHPLLSDLWSAVPENKPTESWAGALGQSRSRPGAAFCAQTWVFSPAGKSTLSTKPSKWAYRVVGWMPDSCPLLGVFTCSQAVRVTERTGGVPTEATVFPHTSSGKYKSRTGGPHRLFLPAFLTIDQWHRRCRDSSSRIFSQKWLNTYRLFEDHLKALETDPNSNCRKHTCWSEQWKYAWLWAQRTGGPAANQRGRG